GAGAQDRGVRSDRGRAQGRLARAGARLAQELEGPLRAARGGLLVMRSDFFLVSPERVETAPTGMGSHHGPVMGKDEWLTPPEVLRALGRFDLDPCAPINRPWDMARRHYTILDNGLTKP